MRTKELIIEIVEELVTYDAEVTRDSKIEDDLRIDFYDRCEIMDGINDEYGLHMSLTDMFGKDWEQSTVGELIDNVLQKLGRLR